MAKDPRAQQKQEGSLTASIALIGVYGAVRANIMARVAHGARSGLLLDYWTPRVAAVIEKALKRIAGETAQSLSEAVSTDRMDAWLEKGALERAEGWASGLDKRLSRVDALAEDFARQVQAQLDDMLADAAREAADIAAAAVEFGASEAAKANGFTSKTWHLGATETGDHRASHKAIDGLTIGIDDRFPNGLRFPRSPGPPKEVSNCQCFLTFGGEA